MAGTATSGIMECYHHTAGFYEVDPYGIVHHSVYLIWAELGMQNYLRERGSFKAYEVGRIRCKYISPAHDRDEITVRARVQKKPDEKMMEFLFPFEIVSGHRLLCKGEIFIRKEGRE